MNTHKQREDALRALCASINDDDGQNPRFDKRTNEHGTANRARKDLQLCKQARRAIENALSISSDSRLHSITLIALTRGETANFTVQVHPNPPLTGSQALTLLRAARPYLRAALASAIHRQRIPELTFELAPSPQSDSQSRTSHD